MGLGVSLISFSPSTVIKSADMNTNLSNLNNASSFTGTFTGGGTFTGLLSADTNKITSDGLGNISAVGTIQFSAGNAKLLTSSGINIFDATGNTDLILNAPNVGSGHKIVLEVGGVRVLSVDATGATIIKGALTQNGAP